VVRGADPAEIEREYEGASGYAGFKEDVAEAVVEHLAPIRERYRELRPDEAALEVTLASGAEKAHSIASATLADVRDAMGIGPPRH
jgi:tryptophanyl-tRNA synthetase